MWEYCYSFPKIEVLEAAILRLSEAKISYKVDRETLEIFTQEEVSGII